MSRSTPITRPRGPTIGTLKRIIRLALEATPPQLRSAVAALESIARLRGLNEAAKIQVIEGLDLGGDGVITLDAITERLEALRAAVKSLVAAREQTRLACVTVIRPASELVGSDRERSATSQRIKNLVLLRHWAESLKLPPSQVSFHVLEGSDPAEAILEYARQNQVDHLVIGAPPRDVTLGGLLGTVATKVSADAPCTVTVVRVRG